jgi:NADPH-dependent curcumin reductase CurA
VIAETEQISPLARSAESRTSGVNRQWTVGRPSADSAGLCLTPAHFVAAQGKMPAPADGEILIRTEYLSPDPMNHAWVRGLPGKFDPLPVGGVMRGGIAGRVVASRLPDWEPGDAVTGFLDWSDYSVSNGMDGMGVPLFRVPPHVELASGLSALGMTGICAWIGLSDYGRPGPGETVLVSGATGGIGSLAGQIAKLMGARIVGIGGGREKCDWLAARGFDAAVDYRAPDLAGQIAKVCPDGVHVFFDNVGGPLLDAALVNMAPQGRIIVCGAAAHNHAEPVAIFNHIQLALKNASMHGFFYFSETHRWGEARRQLLHWLESGEIHDPLDIAEGFEAVPEVAVGQFAGGGRGRKLIRINA